MFRQLPKELNKELSEDPLESLAKRDLADVLQKQGKLLQEGIEKYGEVRVSSKRVFGAHAATWRICSNLAECRFLQGPDHEVTMTAFHKLHRVFGKASPAETEEMHWKSRLRSSEKGSGVEHKDTLYAVFKLGRIYISTHKDEEAKAYLRAS
ncbi:MAG: hypothetical protein M1827_003189 [Pycnora praestabilis]|nr:MAG: hypothetical protein M1827_003189 [Pycnora praestabilis]